jgi:hypothetical protein
MNFHKEFATDVMPGFLYLRFNNDARTVAKVGTPGRACKSDLTNSPDSIASFPANSATL